VYVGRETRVDRRTERRQQFQQAVWVELLIQRQRRQSEEREA